MQTIQASPFTTTSFKKVVQEWYHSYDGQPSIEPAELWKLSGPFSAFLTSPEAQILALQTPFTDDSYSRSISFPLGESAGLKVVVIGWLPGQCTPIHGHGGGCLMGVADGQLLEHRVSPDNHLFVQSESRYYAGAVGYLDDSFAFHDVSNLGTTASVSVHIYYDPKYDRRIS